MRNACSYVLILVAAAAIAQAAAQSTSGIALQVDPGQKVALFVPVQPRTAASFGWTTSLGTFLGAVNEPFATFIAPAAGVSVVTCRVTNAGKSTEHSLAVEVLTDANKPAAAAVQNAPGISSPGIILADGRLSRGLDMGVDSSGQMRNWLIAGSGFLKMSYPAGQSWGAVFITVGRPVPPGNRRGRDMSGYSTLRVEMRGERGGEQVEIGTKDQNQGDDGSEAKETLTLTTEWKSFDIPLRRFAGADLRQAYVLAEFVFDAGPQTVYVRRVEYLPAR